MLERKRGPFVKEDVARRLAILVDTFVAQGWSKREFADAVGWDSAKLSNYLGGRYLPELDSMVPVAERLGFSFEWIVFGSGPVFAEDLNTGGLGPRECALLVSRLLHEASTEITDAVVAGDGKGYGHRVLELMNDLAVA